jgi:hypothetical protein
LVICGYLVYVGVRNVLLENYSQELDYLQVTSDKIIMETQIMCAYQKYEPGTGDLTFIRVKYDLRTLSVPQSPSGSYMTMIKINTASKLTVDKY